MSLVTGGLGANTLVSMGLGSSEEVAVVIDELVVTAPRRRRHGSSAASRDGRDREWYLETFTVTAALVGLDGKEFDGSLDGVSSVVFGPNESFDARLIDVQVSMRDSGIHVEASFEDARTGNGRRISASLGDVRSGDERIVIEADEPGAKDARAFVAVKRVIIKEPENE